MLNNKSSFLASRLFFSSSPPSTNFYYSVIHFGQQCDCDIHIFPPLFCQEYRYGVSNSSKLEKFHHVHSSFAFKNVLMNPFSLRKCLLNAQILFGRNLNSSSLKGVGVLKVVFSNFLDDAGLTQFQN